MYMHLSMAKEHSSIHKGTIDWMDNPIHEKVIVMESHTPKRKGGYGTSKVSIYLEEKNSPIFKTMDEFLKHYKTK